jgi:hypothetical protein
VAFKAWQFAGLFFIDGGVSAQVIMSEGFQ